jgi:methylmalonyl-CoA/ethylmalonyl-CoA epimerase
MALIVEITVDSLGAKPMNSEPLGIARIGQIAIPVRDLTRAIAFYRDVLELPFLFTTGSLAFFQCGEVRLMLSLPEQAGDERYSSILYYQVPDIQAAYATLRQRDVSFVDEPHLIAQMPDHDLWMTFLRDSEENMLGLMGEVRPPQG